MMYDNGIHCDVCNDNTSFTDAMETLDKYNQLLCWDCRQAHEAKLKQEVKETKSND